MGVTARGPMATKPDKDENDHQLRIALEKMGVRIGPITDSTRAVYQRKLRRLSAGNNASVTSNTATSAYQAEQEEEPTISPPAQPQPSPAAGGVVALLKAQFNNPLHIASDTAFLFPEGHVISVSRAVLAITCNSLTPLLYNQEEPYSVNVVTLTGTTCPVWVRGSELAADLKFKLSIRLGVTMGEIRLVHQQDTLGDHFTLRQLGIVADSTVHLVLVSLDQPSAEVAFVGPVTSPVLSVAHMRMGLRLDQLYRCSAPNGFSGRAHLSPHLQHIIHVYDVPYTPLAIILESLYTGEYPKGLPDGNNAFLIASCSILAEHLGLTELSAHFLRQLEPVLTRDSATVLASMAGTLQYKQLHMLCTQYLEKDNAH